MCSFYIKIFKIVCLAHILRINLFKERERESNNTKHTIMFLEERSRAGPFARSKFQTNSYVTADLLEIIPFHPCLLLPIHQSPKSLQLWRRPTTFRAVQEHVTKLFLCTPNGRKSSGPNVRTGALVRRFPPVFPARDWPMIPALVLLPLSRVPRDAFPRMNASSGGPLACATVVSMRR